MYVTASSGTQADKLHLHEADLSCRSAPASWTSTEHFVYQPFCLAKALSIQNLS